MAEQGKGLFCKFEQVNNFTGRLIAGLFFQLLIFFFMSTYFITTEQAETNKIFDSMETIPHNCECGQSYALKYADQVFIVCDSCTVNNLKDSYFYSDIIYQVNCIKKFLNYHSDAFVYLKYIKHNELNGEYIVYGSHVDDNDIMHYVDLFTLSGLFADIKDKIGRIYELTGL